MSLTSLRKIKELLFRGYSTRLSLSQSMLQRKNLVLPKSSPLLWNHGIITKAFHRNVSSSNSAKRKRRSPYAVLGLRKVARQRTVVTQDEVKAAFRKLAKLYHPDLNPNGLPVGECEEHMSELVEAYEKLLQRINGDSLNDDDALLESIKVGASDKVALACELYSVDELLLDDVHEVHTLRMEYASANDTEKTDNDDFVYDKNSSNSSLPVSPTFLVTTIRAHPGDSTLDLKETIATKFGALWGLEDEDCLGWEFLFVQKPKRQNHESGNSQPGDGDTREEDIDDDPTTLASNNVVLSYHLFLEDYHIQHGDTVYVVVRHEK